MSKYQNTSLKQGNSTFIDVEDFNGSTLAFTAKLNRVQVSTQSVDVATAKVVLVKPTPVYACDDAERSCRLGVLNEVFRLEFNATDVASVDAMQAEMERIFALVKGRLVKGIVPGAADTFEDE